MQKMYFTTGFPIDDLHYIFKTCTNVYQSLLWYKAYCHIKLITDFHNFSWILEEFGQSSLIINANLETVRIKLNDLNAQEIETEGSAWTRNWIPKENE